MSIFFNVKRTILPTTDLPTGTESQFVLPGDIDSDGDIDLVFSTTNGSGNDALQSLVFTDKRFNGLPMQVRNSSSESF